MPRLDRWSVVSLCGPYVAPENDIKGLHGFVTGRPGFADGAEVSTSAIATVLGRLVVTESGSVYRLGSIDPAYRKWLRENRPNWNWRDPIRVHAKGDPK